jgi:glutamyl-tRNA reductase
VGYTHRTASLAVRSRFAVAKEDLPVLARRFKGLPGVSGCVLLTTCNRFEAYLEIRSEAEAEAAFVDLLGGKDLEGRAMLARSLMVHREREAAHHLFRVASGLDAMVLGDAQILGQVKEAYRRACQHGTAGPLSHKAFHMAFRCAKRVRNESGVGDGAQSVAGSAVSLLAHRAGGLKGKEFLLVGVNEMTEAAGKRLAKAGAAAVWLGNRTKGHGEDLAREIGARQIDWQDLMLVVAQVDAVITCTGAMEPVFSRAELAVIARQRPDRPLTVVDIAVPPDLDQVRLSSPNQVQPPDLDRSETTKQSHPTPAGTGLLVIDLEDVGAYQQEIEQRRCQAAAAGEQIVNQMVTAFTVWLQNQTLGPKLERLRAEVERTLARELERLPSNLGENEREQLTRFGRTLIKRFLGDYRRVEDQWKVEDSAQVENRSPVEDRAQVENQSPVEDQGRIKDQD